MIRPVFWYKAAVVIAAGAIAAACSSSAGDTTTTSAGSGSQVQALPTLAFTPPSLVVAVNANVTWVFGSVGHTVTFDSTVAGAPANIGTPEAGGIMNSSVTRTFTTAGTYYYHCSIHTSMTGAIIVGSNGVVPPPPPPPPPPAGYLKTKP